ncbi:MAG: L,D-transpeptidase [Gammaproteobacteria bacterium]|nr:L,D-transpeptidase [Gammaproteobacteria bacterium]
MRIKHLFFIIILLLCSPLVHAEEDIWLLIDTQKQELEVKLSDVTLVKYPNISIGRNGSGFKHKRGDDITPLGKYKIAWINRKSKYHLFFGFNYPSVENAREALRKGLVTPKVFTKILIAHKNNQVPPQNTPMGGLIGIHGLGRGDKQIHETMNWTHGCIALTNEQINNLDKLIKKDTIVIVK